MRRRRLPKSALLTSPTPTRCGRPSIRVGPRVRGRYTGSGRRTVRPWDARTLTLLRGVPTGRAVRRATRFFSRRRGRPREGDAPLGGREIYTRFLKRSTHARLLSDIFSRFFSFFFIYSFWFPVETSRALGCAVAVFETGGVRKFTVCNLGICYLVLFARFFKRMPRNSKTLECG